MKSIPLTKVEKSPNSKDLNRNRVYETIAQKISSHSSNPSIATVNDEDLFLENQGNTNSNYRLNDRDQSPNKLGVSKEEREFGNRITIVNAST